MSEYIGKRIVPKHDGVWNSAKSYEPLVIVYEEGTGDSYISRKDVPAGTALSNEDYWALCARFSEQMELYQEDVDAEVAQMQKNLDAAVADMQEDVSDAEDLTNSNKNTLNKRMDTLETRLDANVTASTDPDADYAAEVVDARVDSEGTTHSSLGDAVRKTSDAKFGRLVTPVQINASNYEDYFTDANEVYDGTTYYIAPGAVSLIENLPPCGFSSMSSVCAILSSFNALNIPGGSYQICVYCQIGSTADQYFGAYIRKCFGDSTSYGWGKWRSLTADNLMAHKSVNVEDNTDWFKDGVIEPRYSGMSVTGLGSYFSEEYPLLNKGGFTSVVLEDCGNNNPTVLFFSPTYGAYLSHNGGLAKLGFSGSTGNFAAENEPLTSLKEAPLNSSYFLNYNNCKEIIDDLPGTFTGGYGNLLTFDYTNTCNANGIRSQHGRCQILITSQRKLYFRHEHGYGTGETSQTWQAWTEVGKQADVDLKYGRAGSTQISADNYEDYFTDANEVYDGKTYYIQAGAVALIANLPEHSGGAACVLMSFNSLNIPGGTVQLAWFISGSATDYGVCGYVREGFGTLSDEASWSHWVSVTDETLSAHATRDAADYPEYYYNENVLHPLHKGFGTSLKSYLAEDVQENSELSETKIAIPLEGRAETGSALYIGAKGVYFSRNNTLYKIGFSGTNENTNAPVYTSLKQLPINSSYFLTYTNFNGKVDDLPDTFTSGYMNVLTFSYSNTISSSGYTGQHGVCQIAVTSQGKMYHRFEYGTGTNQTWKSWIEVALQSDVDSIKEEVDELQTDPVKGSVYNHTARIFKTVGCVGDSYTSGHINIGSGTTTTNEDFAWPYYMSLITGQEWVNFGHSGARAGSTTSNWMNLSRGYTKAAAYGICQAYVIGLGINDANNGVTVGDTTSIDDSDQTTYMGGLRVIIDALRELSPDCYIFVQSMPRTGATYLTFNQAMEDTVVYLRDTLGYTHIHYLDLHEYVEMYTNTNLAQDAIQGHYTAQGYEIFAENLEYIMSKYINENYKDFQDVYLQPWEATSTISLTSLEADDSVDEFVGDENEGWDLSETE